MYTITIRPKGIVDTKPTLMYLTGMIRAAIAYLNIIRQAHKTYSPRGEVGISFDNHTHIISVHCNDTEVMTIEVDGGMWSSSLGKIVTPSLAH